MQVDLSAVFQETFGAFWDKFVNFVPLLVIAILVFIIGWFVAVAIGKVVAEVLSRLRFNQIFERTGWKEALEKADLKVNPSDFLGGVFKWVLVIVALQMSVGVLRWNQFSELLGKIVNWLPNVVVAALIFVVAVILADILEKVTRAAVEKSRVGYSRLVGMIVKWAVWIFAVLAILRQLLIAPQLVDTVFGAIVNGTVALLVLSLGIAFGLGGRDVAAEILRDVRNKLKS